MLLGLCCRICYIGFLELTVPEKVTVVVFVNFLVVVDIAKHPEDVEIFRLDTEGAVKR